MDKVQVPHIVSSATFTIGTQVVAQLQSLAAFLALGDQPEQQQQLTSLLSILRDIYDDAKKRDLLIYKDLSEIVSTSL